MPKEARNASTRLRDHRHSPPPPLAALPKLANAATNHPGRNHHDQPANRPTSGYAPVNGIELYYEIHGSGKPLVLLHGGFGSIEMFGPVLPALAEGRQVIGVDLQGHGRTLPFDRPMTFANLATDVAELIKWLGYDKADVMGYSMGGGDGAARSPSTIRRSSTSWSSTSAAYAFAGWHDYNQQGMKGMAAAPEQAVEPMKQTPMYQLYAQLMPDAETNWPKTIDADGETGRQRTTTGRPRSPKITAPTHARLWRLGCRAHLACRVVLRTARRRQAGRRTGTARA